MAKVVFEGALKRVRSDAVSLTASESKKEELCAAEPFTAGSERGCGARQPESAWALLVLDAGPFW